MWQVGEKQEGSARGALSGPRAGCSQHPLEILRMEMCRVHAGQWGLTVDEGAGQSLGLSLPDKEALPPSEAE